MRQVRIWVIGLGMVGRWLLKALQAHQEALARRYGFRATVVAAANARDGFIHAADGLDLITLQRLLADGRPISEHPGADRWPPPSTASGPLRRTCWSRSAQAQAMVSPGRPTCTRRSDGNPSSDLQQVAGRSARRRDGGAGVDHGASLRAESTVMSGTPVLSTLTEGLAGARPIALRGILNATVNVTLTRMAAGFSYEAALAEAQEAGLAERDLERRHGG